MTPEVLARVPAKFHIDPCSVKASGGLEGEHRCMPKTFANKEGNKTDVVQLLLKPANSRVLAIP